MGMESQDTKNPAGLRKVALDDLLQVRNPSLRQSSTCCFSSSPIDTKTSIGATESADRKLAATGATIFG